MILTEWFPGDVKPVHEGVYETGGGMDTRRYFQFWSGKAWSLSSTTVDGAFELRDDLSRRFQNEPWRGLTKEAA
jgi:hypothetical protein